MSKKIIKLINDERRNSKIMSKQADMSCEGEPNTTDYCFLLDNFPCMSGAYDYCYKDVNRSCYTYAEDICYSVDFDRCSGIGAKDADL